MARVSKEIKSLVGGVSQQSPPIRLDNQCEDCKGLYLSEVDGANSRAPSIFVGVIDTMNGWSERSVFTHDIIRDDFEKYIVSIYDGKIKVYDIVNNELKTVNYVAGTNYLKNQNYKDDEVKKGRNSEYLFSAMTIADTTFIVNKTVTVKMSDELTSGYNNVGEFFIFVKSASYNMEYSIYKDKTKIGSYKTTDDTTKYLSTEDISTSLETLLKSNGYTTSRIHSTIYAYPTDGVDVPVSVACSKGVGTDYIRLIKGKCSKFTDLPTVGRNGYVVQIAGSESSAIDDYYVQFRIPDVDLVNVPNDNKYGEGQWIESVKPDIKYKIDSSTMPHILVRNADGTFTFKEYEWKGREKGDEETCGEPSFIGKQVNDIALYRNRLLLVSAENTILSESYKYSNFFATTAKQVLDSDPINTSVSHNKVSDLYHAVPFNTELLLFSPQNQHKLASADVFSPKTTFIKPLTQYDCNVKAKPVSSGRTVFVATNNAGFSGMLEYFVNDSGEVNDAATITAHVPKYIKGEVRQMAVSTEFKTVMVRNDMEKNVVYCYKYLWSGNEKLQSAFNKWFFDENFEILGMTFVGTKLYLTVYCHNDNEDSKICLFSINFQDGLPPDFFDEYLLYYLDFQVEKEQCSCTLLDDGDTEIVLPFSVSKKATTTPNVSVIVDGDKELNIPERECVVIYVNGSKVHVEGDITGKSFRVGVMYDREFVFSSQYTQKNDGQGTLLNITDGMTIVDRFYVSFVKTGFMTVEVRGEFDKENDNQTGYLQHYTARELGNGENILGRSPLVTGTLNFDVARRGDRCTIVVKSRSYLPFRLISAGWTGQFYK